MKINHGFKLNKWLLTLTLALSVNVWAEPIIVEGVVPNDASKQIILNKTSYGTLSSLSPALAALTGFMLLGEKITYLQTVALVCIMLASVGVTVRAARQGSAEKNA